MSFTAKRLTVAFAYASGTSRTIGERRISVRISTPGGQDKGTAEIAIFGMTLSDMNELSVLPTQVNAVGANKITVSAGELGGSMATVFQGTIQSAFVDATAMPEVSFRVSAIAGLVEELKPAPATSYQSETDVATAMQALAGQMGATFENSGVSKKLKFRYFWGSAMAQARALAKEAGVEFVYENGTLAIWPPGQSRSGDSVTISQDTGMVGYPTFSAQGIRVTTMFQPDLKYGGKITVKSSLTPACGDWTVYYLEHSLDAMVPNGHWFTTIDAGRIGGQDNAGQ